MNFVDPILYQCRHNPPGAAMCAPGTALNIISYTRLERFINNIGRRALAAGIHPGDIVPIMIKDNIFHAATALALARIGVTTLSVSDLRLPLGLHVDAIITDVRGPAGNASNPPIIPADLGWTEGDGKPVEDKFLSTGGDNIARIVLTSGSTGLPKAVALSHKLSTRRAARFFFILGNQFAECSRLFSDLGLGSGMNLMPLVYILSRGGTYFFPGASPMDTLQTFNLYGVQGLLASPGGLSEILKFYETNTAFRSGFSVIVSGGSPMHKSLSERVRARLCSNLIFAYGTSETAMVSAAPAHMLAEIAGAVGYVMPGVTVEIIDGEQRVLPPGVEGSLRIRSPAAVSGYFGDQGQANVSFRDGYFHPSDMGMFKDDMLIISGRDREVLNLGGDKMQPEIVEEIITGFNSVDQAAVFGVPDSLGIDRLWALIVMRSPLDEKALRAHCEQRLPPSFWPVRFVTVDRLPRNENGKIERHRLKDFVRTVQSN